MVGATLSFVAGWFVEAIADLPFDLIHRWAEKAAKMNAKEFETADANSIVAWKHFPW